MAACYYYHILSTLLVTNRLFPVSTETILGEKVDDEFDFDGLPGAQHEFKVDVQAGREECFYQFVPNDGKLYISFEVIRGGDRIINFFLLSSSHEMVDAQYSVADGKSEDKVREPGYYQICFDNTFARFGSKLVYFSLATIVMDDWNKFMDEFAELRGLTVNLTSILTGVEQSLADVDQYQLHNRLTVIRDWYLVAGNNVYVCIWSMVQCVVVILAGLGQVFFLRRLFRVTSVTPTLKPRA